MKKLNLPRHDGQQGSEEIEISDSLVLIGANGSGKTRFGFHVDHNTHESKSKRISAQRFLIIPSHAPMRNLEQSLNEFISSSKNRSVIEFENEYDNLLTTVFAKSAKRDNDYVKAVQSSTNYIPVPDSIIDTIINIWNDVFPHRGIKLEDSKVTVIFPGGGEYAGGNMSDGEKVALYLIAQCLLVPNDFLIIIDEPELHLHKSLMNRLWNRIESERNDCTFMYITHDLDFAATRQRATKIWIKSYKPNNTWAWEFLPEIDTIPENLVLEIIGSRKPILFVEGEKGSYDFTIYQHCYKEFTLISRGSGKKVIESTKGIRGNTELHSINAFGLIDRDYMSEDEIAFLKSEKVFVADVAEIENILLTPEVIKIVCSHLELSYEEILGKVVNHTIKSLERDLEREISFKTSLEINYRLNAFDQKQQGSANIDTAIKKLVGSIDVNAIYVANEKKYKEIIATTNFESALRHYTNKGLLPEISIIFGLRPHEYSKLVLRLLKTDKGQDIVEAINKFLPKTEELV